MLRNLLSPLRSAGFDSLNPLSPRPGLTPNSRGAGSTSPSLDEPEDFAHDVRVDIMRRSVEELKEGAGVMDLLGLTELLEILRRVMVEDRPTILIFLELDGLLGLLSALQVVCALLQPSPSPVSPSSPSSNSLQVPSRGGKSILALEKERTAQMGAVRAALEVLDQVLRERSGRAAFYANLGWETLTGMLLPLSPLPGLAPPLLGALLALALSDFSPPILHFFLSQSPSPPASFTTSVLQNPETVRTLLALLPGLQSFSERAALVGCILQLAQSGPFNLARLSSPKIDLLEQLVGLLFPSPVGKEPTSPSAQPSSQAGKTSYKLDDSLRPLLLKLTKLLLRTSSSVSSARALFALAVRPSPSPSGSGTTRTQTQTIDPEVLSLLAEALDNPADGFGWPAFLSLAGEGSAGRVVDRAVGPEGLTFLSWIYLPRLPSPASSPTATTTTSPTTRTQAQRQTQTLLTLSPNPPVSAKFSVRLSITSDGGLLYETSSSKGEVRFGRSRVRRGEWVLLGVVHSKAEGKCNIFLNGQLTESLPTPWPKVPASLEFRLGSPEPPPSSSSSADSASPQSSPDPASSPSSSPAPARHNPHHKSSATPPPQAWIYLGPTHLLPFPLAAEVLLLPRILGPHYTGQFRAGLVHFLTYAAATGLHVQLEQGKEEATRAGAAPGGGGGGKENGKLPAGKGRGRERESSGNGPVVRALRDGLVPESVGVWGMIPARSFAEEDQDLGGTSELSPNLSGADRGWSLTGDAHVVDLLPLRSAVYAIGGASLGLRLVLLARTELEIREALRVALGMMRESWRNSQEMEGYNGYDVLANLLRRKAPLVSEAVLDVILSAVGVNRQDKDRCLIINTIAYRALLLDFDLWSRTALPVQRAFLAHFALVVSAPTYRRFNIKHRFAKFGIVRLLLYSLRFTPWQDEVVKDVLDALRAVAGFHFSGEHTIKPLVTYLVTNLHPESESVISPLSMISTQYDTSRSYDKALQVFDMLLSLLHTRDYLAKFIGSVSSVSRYALLFLGSDPSPDITTRVLRLLALVSQVSPSFPRKFELVHGWLVLRHILPMCWEEGVQKAAFDLLLGRAEVVSKQGQEQSQEPVYCLSIMPAILASFFVSIERSAAGQTPLPEAGEDASESLADALLELLESHPQLFRSKSVITLFTQFAHNALAILPPSQEQHPLSRSLVDKLTHITVMLSLDERIATTQRTELTRLLQVLHSPSTHSASNTPQSTPKTAKSIDTHGLGTVQTSLSRTATVRANLRKIDKEQVRRYLQDEREGREQIDQQTAWQTATDFDRGLWVTQDAVRTWKVDETEGPFRTRKKLEAMEQQQAPAPPKNVPTDTAALSTSASDRRFNAMDLDDNASVVQHEPPPWNDNDSSMSPEHELEGDVVDDKHRRVRGHLATGDVIQATFNVYRIVGIDSSPGLLILGKTHLYLLEGLVETKDKEIIDARDAPKDLLTIPSGTVVEMKKHRPADKWTYEDIAGVSKRTCLFRDVALELYLRDNRSLLLVFETTPSRQTAFSRIGASRSGKAPAENLSAFPLRTGLASAVSAVGARFSTIGAGRAELETATRKWQARELSNFAYLAIVNQAAGRTPNDITQYPVFPWIIQDYDSETLDLTKSETYRDLTCPMGALTPDRRSAALERYVAQMGEQPFHYGTHFSSSMIVCHFLLRLQPFTRMFQELQGGNFDLADRLFRDVGKAWSSAAHESRGDVRELIPEFFTCPEFLQNVNNLNLGTLSTGEKVGDVTLPVWAMKDPLLFISLHRQALESDQVSKHLPRWIDLIFGVKQKDVTSLNVYHPLTYEGAIDLETITDSWEREATVGAIHNFGQTPRQVFKTTHPDRFLDGKTTLPLGTPYGIAEDFVQLKQGNAIGKKILEPVDTLYIDTVAERILACPAQRRFVPQTPHEHVEWSLSTHSISFFVDRKVVHIEEETPITVAEFYDSRILVTGSDDSTVSIWRIMRGDQSSLRLVGSMRGHNGRVNCIATSRGWAMAVTGAADGLVIVWDVNRVRYVRSMAHETPVEHVAIGPSGEIASSSRTAVSLHTVNGQHIASFRPMEPISCLAFHEREYSAAPILATACGEEIRLWTWNATTKDEAGKAVWKFTMLRTMKCRKAVGGASVGVTALEFVGESLYHGDSEGNVYSWGFPE